MLFKTVPENKNLPFDVINKVQFKNEVTFIAFENMYRASSTVQKNSEASNPYLNVIDAVVDKIIPPQKKDSLDVIVENYGSIILDESVARLSGLLIKSISIFAPSFVG